VHRLDAARLFRLAAEAAPAASRLHAAAEEGVPFRDIAEAIGRQLNIPVVSVAAEDAGGHFGFLSAFASADNPTSSALTQERLGWRPDGPALIADIEQGPLLPARRGRVTRGARVGHRPADAPRDGDGRRRALLGRGKEVPQQPPARVTNSRATAALRILPAPEPNAHPA
jgi:hypothetical protein